MALKFGDCRVPVNAGQNYRIRYCQDLLAEQMESDMRSWYDSLVDRRIEKAFCCDLSVVGFL